MKKWLAILVSVLLLATMIPMGVVSVGAATETIRAKLDSIISKYPVGSTWTKTFDGGSECYGFAKKVIYELFGKKGSTYRTWLYNGTPTVGMTKVGTTTSLSKSKVKALLQKAKVGDVIQLDETDQHSMIVYQVNNDGVVIYDCNGGEKYCEIALDAYGFDYWSSWDTARMTLLRADNYDEVNVPLVPILSMHYHANGGSIDSKVISTTYQVTESAGLNMRKDAGKNKIKITALPKNATFTVKAGDTKTADGYTWGKTTYNGHTGWVVISDFVRKTGSERSGNFYLYSSMVYVSSSEKVETTIWKLGSGNGDGLRNAGTFNLTRDGYVFVGWCTQADGSATIFDQHDGTVKAEDIYPDLKNGSATITLYAIWDHVAHTYDDDYDSDCNECGAVREVPEKPTLIYGDANGDGAVNNRDLAMMQQYINKWDVEIDESAADVNVDGVINNRDLALLQQYINKWDVELGQ